ncbi:MAG: ribonuclease P protein component [Bdellovibrionales bacterium]
MVAANHKLETLRKRAEFLSVAASGKRWVAPGFILQVGKEHEPSPRIRYGLTASGKIGNAVVRNRARRRLRALAAQILPQASSEHDYVLVARAPTPSCDYASLQQELVKGLKQLKLWHRQA